MSKRPPRRWNRNVHVVADWILLSAVVAAPDFDERPAHEQEHLTKLLHRMWGTAIASKTGRYDLDMQLVRLAYRQGKLTPDEWNTIKRQGNRDQDAWSHLVRSLCPRLTGFEYPADEKRLARTAYSLLSNWCRRRYFDPTHPPLRPMRHHGLIPAGDPQPARHETFWREWHHADEEGRERLLVTFLLEAKEREPDPIEIEPIDPEMVPADDQDRIDATAAAMLDQLDWDGRL